MLFIICGEDSVASRNYLKTLIDQYKSKNYVTENTTYGNLAEIAREENRSNSLFGENKIYLIENLNKNIQRKGAKDQMELLTKIHSQKDIILLDWEDGRGQRELKIAKAGTVKEFKLNETIFKLLDACYPSNLQVFLKLLNTVSDTQDPIFIFVMLTRHIRNLLLAKTNQLPPALPSWIKYKYLGQAKFWKTEELTKFYEGLGRIDVNIKTNSGGYDAKESLDILACYFL